MEGVERYKVKLIPHNPEWEKEFIMVKGELLKCWGANIIDIQHVGSTAIKAICAKPILDIAVQLESIQNMDIDALTRISLLTSVRFSGFLQNRNTPRINRRFVRGVYCVS